MYREQFYYCSHEIYTPVMYLYSQNHLRSVPRHDGIIMPLHGSSLVKQIWYILPFSLYSNQYDLEVSGKFWRKMKTQLYVAVIK